MVRAFDIQKKARNIYLGEIAILTEKKAEYDDVMSSTAPAKPLAIEHHLSKLQASFENTSIAEDCFKQTSQYIVDDWVAYNGMRTCVFQPPEELATNAAAPPGGAGESPDGSGSSDGGKKQDLLDVLMCVATAHQLYHQKNTDSLLLLRDTLLLC